MKRLFLILVLLLFTFRSHAGMLMMGGGTPAAGGSCTAFHTIITGNSSFSIAYEDANLFTGQLILDTTSSQICQVNWDIYDLNGNTSGIGYRIEIFAINASYGFTPASPLGVSNTITGVTTGTNTFTFSTPVTLTGGTDNVYGIIITRADHTSSSANYASASVRTTDGNANSAFARWSNTGSLAAYEVAVDHICVFYRQ
jgi:hypothetical protein